MTKLMATGFLTGCLTLANGWALASGDASGTTAVGELNITGPQFLMMLGAVAALGGVVWGVIKVCSK
jgi:hypothetical protein